MPTHFIQEVTIKLNGKTVIEGQISQAVSRNRVFLFRMNSANAGDKIGVSWRDNKGDKNSSETSAGRLVIQRGRQINWPEVPFDTEHLAPGLILPKDLSGPVS